MAQRRKGHLRPAGEAQGGEGGRDRHREPGHGEDGRWVEEDPEGDGEHREQEDKGAAQPSGAERDAGDAHGGDRQVEPDGEPLDAEPPGPDRLQREEGEGEDGHRAHQPGSPGTRVGPGQRHRERHHDRDEEQTDAHHAPEEAVHLLPLDLGEAVGGTGHPVGLYHGERPTARSSAASDPPSRELAAATWISAPYSMSLAESTSRLEVTPSPKPRLAEAAAAAAVSRSSRASASRCRATSTSRAAFWTSCRTWSRVAVS